jgi:hypothetical protein
MDVEGDEQGRAGLAGRVDMDFSHTCLGTGVGEAAPEVGWFDRPATGGGEDEARLLPAISRRFSGGVACPLAGTESRRDDLGKGSVASDASVFVWRCSSLPATR